MVHGLGSTDEFCISHLKEAMPLEGIWLPQWRAPSFDIELV